MDNSTLLFVYGTLKKGHFNHARMMGSDGLSGTAVFEGSATTCEAYPLYVQGLPFLLNIPGTGHPVHGEVYRVDAVKLNLLDRFEGHPHSYRRDKVKVDCHGEQLECQTYFYTRHQGFSSQQPVAKF